MSMDRDTLSKLKRYIRENRPHKLKMYTQKHRLKLSEIILYKKRNLLHYCCKYGSAAVMRYLVSEGVRGAAVDTDLCTPVHLVIQLGLTSEDDGHHDVTTEYYTEMILPLIQAFPDCMDMKNKSGLSCRQLLHQLVQKRQLAENHNQDREELDKGDSVYPSVDEAAWREKLADEWQDEYHTTLGHYEPDFGSCSGQNETYDDWADRIREEYYARKNSYQSTQRTQRGKRKHSGEKTKEQEELEGARAKMRKRFEEHAKQDKEINLLKKRMKYEERYRNLLTGEKKILLGFDDVPWPSEQGQTFDVEVLFAGMDTAGLEYKKYLRDQQIRWHPDKFLQRFGHMLAESEKDRVLKRVTHLSQTLNKLKT